MHIQQGEYIEKDLGIILIKLNLFLLFMHSYSSRLLGGYKKGNHYSLIDLFTPNNNKELIIFHHLQINKKFLLGISTRCIQYRDVQGAYNSTSSFE